MAIYIGTSGFSYPAWKEKFYPAGMPSAQWLTYFSTRFNSLELNSTFYRFPRVETLLKMCERTSNDFVFSVKMNKAVTHTMRMKNARSRVDEFTAIAAEGFGDKLGCILFQLPPSFRYTEENLHHLLESVPVGSRNVIEFRDISWWNEEVRDALRRQNLTICNVSYPSLPEDKYMTSEVFYQRMHGIPELFKSPYSEKSLDQLVEGIPGNAASKYIYFNNTMFDAGYTNAAYLQELLIDNTKEI